MTQFRKLAEELVWQGHVVSAATATFVSPDGEEFTRDIVHHPGAVSIVPIVDDGDGVLLVKQFRAALNRELLEIPAGKCDIEGENPELTAKRELEEEVGMRTGRIERLAEFYNSPGFCDEHSFIYMGLDLEPCEISAQGIEETYMTIEKVGFDEIPALIATGAIVDGKTILGLLLARDALA